MATNRPGAHNVPDYNNQGILAVASPIKHMSVGGESAVVDAVVLQQLTNLLGFGAAIAACEVPIWVGGLVSRRGRNARARNGEARAAYEAELAEHRAMLSSHQAV